MKALQKGKQLVRRNPCLTENGAHNGRVKIPRMDGNCYKEIAFLHLEVTAAMPDFTKASPFESLNNFAGS